MSLVPIVPMFLIVFVTVAITASSCQINNTPENKTHQNSSLNFNYSNNDSYIFTNNLPKISLPSSK